MKKTMLAATLLISNSALAASILVLPPDDKQMVAASDSFTIDIEGLGFTDGSKGGGLDISWDSTLMSLQSVTRTFPGDMSLGSDGTETAPGFLQDLSVSSIFTGTALTEFPIATLEFILNVGSIETDIAVALGTFTTGAGFDIWTDNNSLAVCDGSTNLCDYGGAKINAVIPVPAAFWLFTSALGILGWVRSRLWK